MVLNNNCAYLTNSFSPSSIHITNASPISPSSTSSPESLIHLQSSNKVSYMYQQVIQCNSQQQQQQQSVTFFQDQSQQMFYYYKI